MEQRAFIWVRQRVRMQIVHLLLESFFSALFGVGILALVWGIIEFIAFRQFLVVALGVVFASFMAARYWRADEHQFGSGGSPMDANGMSLFMDILSGGGRFILSAVHVLFRSVNLMRADLKDLTAVILWIFQKGHKVHASEIASQFPQMNTVRILPLLRDLDGVVWLVDVSGVLLLSEEFRRTFATALKIPWVHASHEYHRPAEERPPEHEVNSEEAQWYRTLGLPPYASLIEVKKKYRQLAKLHHPDVSARQGRPDSSERMTQINLAYHNILAHS